MKLLEEMTRTLTHRGPDAQKCELFPVEQYVIFYLLYIIPKLYHY